jgi:hypothetical protein
MSGERCGELLSSFAGPGPKEWSSGRGVGGVGVRGGSGMGRFEAMLEVVEM